MIENEDQTDETRNNASKTRGRPFERGNSGRPKGARHKISLLAEKLMSDDVEGVVQTVVQAAKNGDMTAARLILERVSPPRKDNPVALDLPEVKTLDDAALAMSIVIEAVSSGNISPSEGSQMTSLIREFSTAVEVSALEKRLSNLESMQDKK